MDRLSGAMIAEEFDRPAEDRVNKQEEPENETGETGFLFQIKENEKNAGICGRGEELGGKNRKSAQTIHFDQAVPKLLRENGRLMDGGEGDPPEVGTKAVAARSLAPMMQAMPP